MTKQKTIHEKWRSDSKEPMAGLRFHDTPGSTQPVELVGFTEAEMRELLGEDKPAKSQIDEIEEL